MWTGGILDQSGPTDNGARRANGQEHGQIFPNLNLYDWLFFLCFYDWLSCFKGPDVCLCVEGEFLIGGLRLHDVLIAVSVVVGQGRVSACLVFVWVPS